MEEEQEEHEPIKISKYNSAIAQLYRIDFLWQDSHSHARAGKLMKWNWDLDRVWCELSADAKEEDEKSLQVINNEIAQLSKIKNPPELFSKMYQLLMKKEILLRKIQNAQGKGTAWLDEDNDMM